MYALGLASEYAWMLIGQPRTATSFMSLSLLECALLTHMRGWLIFWVISNVSTSF